jgi:hypothetical protein
MQNAVADQRVQGDAFAGTTTISLRTTIATGPEQGRSEIEVIPETPPKPGPMNDLDAVFCRDLIEFLGDFKSAAPKSSTGRRQGPTVAHGTPATRDSAPHQDILFDFLRAYEAAPKMRPLSRACPVSGAPEPGAKSLRPIATPPTVAQPEDAPFRVPPYVSAASENTTAEEALLDVDGAWPDPQPSPAPLAERPVRVPGAKRQGSVPAAKRPAPVPVDKQPGLVIVAEKPALVVAAPGPVIVAEKPALVVAAPGPVIVAEKPALVVAAPSPAPVGAAKRPDAKPAQAQVKKRPEPRPAPAPAAKPLGPAAARAKAIEEGMIV